MITVIIIVLLALLLFLLWDWWQQYRMPAYAGFQQHYQNAFDDVCRVMSAQKNPWWLTEGTLIWSLRYGKNFPPELVDRVDDDIDIMLETQSHEQWMRLSQQIAEQLIALGWHGLNRRSTSPRKYTRKDKMQLFYRKGIWLTHVDIHNYIVDEKNQTVFSNGQKEDYPFEYWQGRAPLALIKPFKSCLAYGKVLQCPANPHELLAHWHGNEYDGSPLAYPLRKISEKEKAIIDDYAKKLAAQGMANWMDCEN